MTNQSAYKILGCTESSARRIAEFTLRTATRECPLKVKVAARFILETH